MYLLNEMIFPVNVFLFKLMQTLSGLCASSQNKSLIRHQNTFAEAVLQALSNINMAYVTLQRSLQSSVSWSTNKINQ